MLLDQFKDNPLVRADMQFRQQQPMIQQERVPSQEELTSLGKAGKLFLRTDCRGFAENRPRRP